MKTKILNVPFDVVTQSEALEIIMNFLQQNKCHILCTPNPEMVMEAKRDSEFMHILQNADLVVPDGIGIVLASRLNKLHIKERVAGCDLMFELFDKIKSSGHTVYLLGGKPGVHEQAKKNMESKFKKLHISGGYHGYFDAAREKEIIAEIQRLKPDILLCGLGFPKQEKWIYNNKDILPVKLCVGVGGSLDVMANTVKRAPLIYRKLGLEWFYRLIKQPSRIVRMTQLPLFIAEVIKDKIKNIR